MRSIEDYYSKFNEEKRLDSRHGQVEFLTSLKYIHKYLKKQNNPNILDIGAGTGKYSVLLANEGYDVTAIELVKSNLGTLKAKHSTVKAYQGNALDLSKFEDNSFSLTLLFGPMYHLFTLEDQLQALKEAKRVTKKDGIIMVAYCMNDYAIIIHGFKEKSILNDIKNGKVDKKFNTCTNIDDLYHYMSIKGINELNKLSNLHRLKIIAADGAANYMRSNLKEMNEKEFNIFLKYHFSSCERKELIGASAHTIDILKKL